MCLFSILFLFSSTLCLINKIQTILFWNVGAPGQFLSEELVCWCIRGCFFHFCVVLNRSGGAGRLPRQTESADGWERGPTGGGEAEILDSGAQVTTYLNFMLADLKTSKTLKSFAVSTSERPTNPNPPSTLTSWREPWRRWRRSWTWRVKTRTFRSASQRMEWAAAFRTAWTDHLHVCRNRWRPGFDL